MKQCRVQLKNSLCSLSDKVEEKRRDENKSVCFKCPFCKVLAEKIFDITSHEQCSKQCAALNICSGHLKVLQLD